MRMTQVLAAVFGLVAMSVACGQKTRGADPSLAGHQVSGVTVPPLPTPPLPEGHTGIAAKYPGDMGIENDPDVVFVEPFEASVDEICRHWEAVAGKPIMSKSDEVAPGKGTSKVSGGTTWWSPGSTSAP